jgi:hypothetical protein
MRTTLTKSLIAGLALLVALGAFSGAAWAKTIFVNDATGVDVTCGAPLFATPCKTIAVAVALLAPGDTIQIFPGFYGPPTLIATIVITVPNVTIVGSGPSTIVDGTIISPAPFDVFQINANNVTIANMRIQGALGGSAVCADLPSRAAGIRVGNTTGPIVTSGAIIRNVELTGNEVGIAICSSNNAQIISNNIHDNTNPAQTAVWFGLALDRATHVLVQSNIFSNFPAAATAAGTGIFVVGSADDNAHASFANTISSNTFSGFLGATLAAITTAAINLGAFSGRSSGLPTPIGNTIERNTFSVLATTTSPSSKGVLLSASSAVGNTIQSNTFDRQLDIASNATGEDGIFFSAAATHTTIDSNQFRRMTTNFTPVPAVGGSGINFAATAAATNTVVTNSLLTDNSNGITFSVALALGANDQFTRNVITKNGVGVRVTVAQAAAANEIFTQNNIEGNTTAGWSFTTIAIVPVAVANFAGTFVAFNNWWGNTLGPNCPIALACNTPGAGNPARLTPGDSVINTAGGPVPLTTDFFSAVPFATVFGTSLERAPAPLTISSIQAMGLGGFRPGLQVRVQGLGIAGVQLQVYDLSGRIVAYQSASGASLRWNGLSSHGQTLANGVYLYVVTVKGYDGKVVNSEVRKLVILR